MKSFPRFIVALSLTVIYVVITMSPLAPLAMRSPAVAHAVTGECAGDCDICGCSPEMRANHTCCCWKKKLQHDHERKDTGSCCKKKRQSGKPVLRCGCPCGGNNQLASWGESKYEHLPYRFSEEMLFIHQDKLLFIHQNRLIDRYGDPPDPPPKFGVLSS